MPHSTDFIIFPSKFFGRSSFIDIQFLPGCRLLIFGHGFTPVNEAMEFFEILSSHRGVRKGEAIYSDRSGFVDLDVSDASTTLSIWAVTGIPACWQGDKILLLEIILSVVKEQIINYFMLHDSYSTHYIVYIYSS